MKPNPMRQLEHPPADLLARVMGEVRTLRRPPSVGWIATAQTVVLAALLMAATPTALPTQLATTAETVREWSVSLAQATLDLSADVDRVFGLNFQEGEI